MPLQGITVEIWQTGQPQRTIHTYETSEGTIRWVDISASPLREKGSITQVIAVYRDVTSERRLEEKLAGVYILGRELVLTRNERQITQVAVDAGRIMAQSPVCALWLLEEQHLVCWTLSSGAHVTAREPIPLDKENIISDVVQRGESVCIPHLKDERERRYQPIDPQSQSVLAVPLKMKSLVIGALVVERPKQEAFDQEDEQILFTLAAQTAVALENARLYRKMEREIAERKEAKRALERHALRLLLLNEISGRITATLELDELFEKAAHLVQERFNYHQVTIFTMDQEREALVMRIRANESKTDASPGYRLELGQGLVGWAGQHGETVMVNNVEQDVRYVDLHLKKETTRSELSVPIQVGDTLLGVLDIQSPERNAFDEDDLMVMETLADQIAVAMENARLYQAEREQRRLVEQSQAQLVQSEKLAATGRLTASLAHEINNPLQTIHNSLQIMLAYPLDPAEQQEYLQMADEDVERLIKMVGRMLDFARRPQQEKKFIQVNQVIVRTLKLSKKYLQHRDIVLQKELAPNLPPILAIPGELQQVFLNLLLNGVDAMDEGGTMQVASRLEEDDQVLISFTDTGQGIQPEYLGRVFEPFFSTKENGTGLGLSVSYNIVKGHKGEITVQSEIGKGTTFTVQLPAIPREETP